MYKVEISPNANAVLKEYVFRCARDQGEACALHLLDSFDEKINYLEEAPFIGCGRLQYIPPKYRVLNFWPHLWFVYQIKEQAELVTLDFIIDDRQNYGPILF